METILDLVLEMKRADENGQTQSSKYVTSSMREDIDTTEAYLNSKHTSGEFDSLGREKPFLNIVVGQRNIWFRATDLDRKNIRIKADKASDTVKAFLATIKLQEWMRKANFGQFLNDWGLTLANHGSAVCKFVEQDGELKARVMDWNTIIVDPIDFEGNPVIEKIWYTPAQLKKNKSYDKEMVKKLLDNLETRKTIGGQKKDQKADYICVYEVHGELPLSFLTGDINDEDEYVQQMHVLSLTTKKDSVDEFEAHSLYSGRERKNPYMLTHLIKKDGQTYAGGAVKNSFQAQWMVNHNAKLAKDQLDLSSKMLFQTSDGSFEGQNILTSVENGDIFHHKPNEPITQLNNRADIAAMQSEILNWQNNSFQMNGISEAMAGQNAPSGTAWRQVEALLQESHSLFELMTENKGLAIEQMLREFIIPFFKTKLDTTEEISEILEDHQIKQIDAMFIPNEAIRRVNQKKKETILKGEIYDPGLEGQDLASAEAEIRSGLTGNQRFIKPSDIDSVTWKEIFKDLEWDVEVDVTGEQKDTQSAMATMTTLLQTYASNPALFQDPTAKMILNRTLALTGAISPLELQVTPSLPPAQPTPQQVPQMTQ